jgi:uncharacterized repeat protein (TIGR04138 family)
MKKPGFTDAVDEIVARDPRYQAEAYQFVREGLEFTIKLYSKPAEGAGRHVSGAELLEGLRRFALQEFGPIARRVLGHWGVNRTEDFGNIVFNMVNHGILGKTDEDRVEHFAGGYDFEDVFKAPFLPAPAPETLQPKEEN